ncbi:CPXCG motif-containing cysteine-rich protein [Aliivibrio logei]|uniref:CPXCG motif-containing cysteine-rich protein n=1 Tax=Aliivibrio logei TaxID=688 RepID=UPI0003A9A168|nr:CPXCG motif-containing cysteine-rich protein [Aliivibrio logei]
MEFLHEEIILCPYCNESIVILVDQEDRDQEYIDDCSVCCRPIRIQVTTNDNDELVVTVCDENEA